MSKIEDDLAQLLIVRYYYHQLFEVVMANSKLHVGSQFYSYHEHIYLTTIISGIRRQLKGGGENISIRGLLHDITQNSAEAITHSESAPIRQASRVIDASQVQSWIEDLASNSRLVEQYADRRISHLDRREPSELPTLAEIDDALVKLEEICLGLSMLLEGSAPESLLPTNMDDDWKQIFTLPWIE